jgi:hypothetical protein
MAVTILHCRIFKTCVSNIHPNVIVMSTFELQRNNSMRNCLNHNNNREICATRFKVSYTGKWSGTCTFIIEGVDAGILCRTGHASVSWDDEDSDSSAELISSDIFLSRAFLSSSAFRLTDFSRCKFSSLFFSSL